MNAIETTTTPSFLAFSYEYGDIYNMDEKNRYVI